ncbi:uncharacterized protein B0H18DRAFT_883764 [Fomitopsis serialis]|uniref:uncharacterized protein n=2 Tax=Fomitopsis serialis TaxID=139415 RepID=UPI002008715F|nr:uncharacterized protein B0H18DRAFT_883764 [Neoantrodia serialis]KAH9917477.1 hypothetical protein B0H18DRAFT_883764 [Neoantrodia serialis]
MIPFSPAGTPLSLLTDTPRRRKTPRVATPSASRSPGIRPEPIQAPPNDVVQQSPSRLPTPTRPPPPPPRWPRLNAWIPDDEWILATKHVFGYGPMDWQLGAATKILETNDSMIIAGTGAGKSLVFALLAIAAELTKSDGLVLVVCPLKALQLDQVRTHSPIVLYLPYTCTARFAA